jgi:hypothetical protein
MLAFFKQGISGYFYFVGRLQHIAPASAIQLPAETRGSRINTNGINLVLGQQVFNSELGKACGCWQQHHQQKNKLPHGRAGNLNGQYRKSKYEWNGVSVILLSAEL